MSELDLREFIARPDELEATLTESSLLWVRGGNTFVLRAQLARSGGDVVLDRLLRDDALVYAGYSAGACVLAPSLVGLEFTDDPGEVASTCNVETRWDGMFPLRSGAADMAGQTGTVKRAGLRQSSS